MIVSEPLVVCNKRSKSGIIYTTKSMENMISNWKSNNEKVLVYSRPPLDNEDIAPILRDVCGEVENLSLIDNVVFVTLKTFDSTINPITKRYKNGQPCYFVPFGKPEKIISSKNNDAYLYVNYRLQSVNMVDDCIWT